MDRNNIYRVAIPHIVSMPAGRERSVLARKALAAAAGLPSTSRLRSLQVTTGEEVMGVLVELAKDTPTFPVALGLEPMDRSDSSSVPVSLERWSAEIESIETERVEETVARTEAFMARDEFEAACEVAVKALHDVHGRGRRRVVAILRGNVGRSAIARLFFGRSLIFGDGVRRNRVKGETLVRECLWHDDSDISGYAHLILGEALMGVVGRERESMRHFENAGHLGFDEGWEFAGVTNQLGGRSLPNDSGRAAENYLRGARNGHPGCMGKYAVMVLAGFVDYDADWPTYYDAAVAAGDETRFLEIFREAFARRIDMVETVDEAVNP